jgi:AcrR family transcriptional regulator
MEKGIANFRLKDLAGRLQVTMPNLYRYFDNREDIVSSTFLYAYRQLHTHEISQLVPPENGWTNAADFFTHLRNCVKDPANYDPAFLRTLRIQAIAGTLFDATTKSEMARLQHSYVDGLAGLIRQAQKAGAVSELIEADTVAFLIQSARIGFIMDDLTHPDRSLEEDVWNLYEAAFLLLAG